MKRKALWIFLAVLAILLTAGAILLLTLNPDMPPAAFLTYAAVFITGFLAAGALIAKQLMKGENDGQEF